MAFRKTGEHISHFEPELVLTVSENSVFSSINAETVAGFDKACGER